MHGLGDVWRALVVYRELIRKRHEFLENARRTHGHYHLSLLSDEQLQLQPETVM